MTAGSMRSRPAALTRTFTTTAPSAWTRSRPGTDLDVGVTKAHLVREYNKALEAKTTQPCNRQCSACGANS